MQEEDWGKYSQAPWMTGGSWKDATNPKSSKKPKAKRPARVPTIEPAYGFSEDTSSQNDDKFQAEVDLADLKIALLRWNFARSWRSASSRSLADEPNISPRSHPRDVKISATCSGRADVRADQAGKIRSGYDDLAALSRNRVNTTAKSNPPLDGNVIGQYLDKCIAATEYQLARAGSKAKKKEAVKEIERLVEKVVTQAGLVGERTEVGVVTGDVVGTVVGVGRRGVVEDKVVGGRKARRG